MDLLLKALGTAYWEMGEAFKGLTDADLWRRPHPRLLSVGELAAHVAYGEAAWFLGEGAVRSPLLLSAARYYPYSIVEPFQIPMRVEEVDEEIHRIHSLSKVAFLAEPRDPQTQNPYRTDQTWGSTLEYQAFHVAYHTGQMYSVRHLLGHETANN